MVDGLPVDGYSLSRECDRSDGNLLSVQPAVRVLEWRAIARASFRPYAVLSALVFPFGLAAQRAWAWLVVPWPPQRAASLPDHRPQAILCGCWPWRPYLVHAIANGEAAVALAFSTTAFAIACGIRPANRPRGRCAAGRGRHRARRNDAARPRPASSRAISPWDVRANVPPFLERFAGPFS